AGSAAMVSSATLRSTSTGSRLQRGPCTPEATPHRGLNSPRRLPADTLAPLSDSAATVRGTPVLPSARVPVAALSCGGRTRLGGTRRSWSLPVGAIRDPRRCTYRYFDAYQRLRRRDRR